MNKMKSLALFAGVAFSSSVSATIVEIQTSEGSFQINLFDRTTPQTVANFLQYVEEGSYDNVVFHRLSTDFVLQGGGYTYDEGFNEIATYSPILNEPNYSNVRGTIAMAKLSRMPHSATSQWYINLDDNSAGTAKLDTENGGYTVFGQVIGDGMDIVDHISQYHCNGIPVVNTTDEECDELISGDETVTNEQLITINSVIVIDDSTYTADDLNPVENTLIDTVPTNPDNTDNGGGFGGLLALLGGLVFARRKYKAKQ